MELRRCPACRNMISPRSVTCPICGLSYAQAWVRKLGLWVILAIVLLVTIVYHVRK